MKKKNHLYEQLEDIDFIFYIYENQIKKNTKNKMKIEKFENYLLLNIINIYNQIKNKQINFEPYHIFLVKEPKYRLIMSQTIKDKIINHMVSRKILLNVFEKSFIDANVATLRGKGTSYGRKLTKKYINEIKKENKRIYYLKCDISKYFYNIDHEVLKQKINKKIKDEAALHLIYQIIDSSNDEKLYKKINKICMLEYKRIENKKTEDIEKRKQELMNIPKLFKKGKSIPIGNMTSQVFAVLYLNDFDHYVKEKLHMRYYVRYMDDFVFLSSDKEKLKQIYKEIKVILNKEYRLDLNPKTHIGTLENGLDFLGFHFILKNNKLYMRIRNRIKRNFKQKMKNYKENANLLNIIASYKGIILNGNGYSLFTRTLRQNNIIYENYGIDYKI